MRFTEWIKNQEDVAQMGNFIGLVTNNGWGISFFQILIVFYL